jgi:hypothetical protein
MRKNFDNILMMMTEGTMVWFSVMLYKSLGEVVPIPKEYAEIIVMSAFLLCKIASMSLLSADRAKKERSTVDLEPLIDHSAEEISVSQSSDLTKQRMQLFHDEYKQEEQQYRQQKEKAENEKLQAILRYTRDTFKRLEFEETEVYQICESVRYFVTNRQVLTQTDVRIKRKAAVTQIDLKNFAWNIAFQYGIGGDITAQFVMQTFNEWFVNCTIDTIRKNLRTTTGRRKIEINETIV